MGNLNPYIYTYQNPIKYIYPNGKQTIAKGTYSTAFVYHVSGDVGHTSIGYYGKYDKNPGVLYAPLSGNSTYRQSRKGEDGWYSGISEAQTIKSYLDGGDKVERYHYKLRDKAMQLLASLIVDDVLNPGSTFDQQYCTLQASQAIRMSYQAIQGVDVNEAANEIIPYRFPSDLSHGQVLKTGSVEYDVFTKEKGKYYMTTHRWDPKKVGKDWFQKKVLGLDVWSSIKKEIKFSK